MNNLTQELQLLEHQLEGVSHTTLNDAGAVAVHEAQSTTLFHHSSDFENKIKFHPHGPYEGEVVSEADFSAYLEYGNDPGGGVIVPVAANVLHFFANGEEVFTKHVKAHGPLPFMDQAADKVEQELPDLWYKNFDKHIR